MRVEEIDIDEYLVYFSHDYLKNIDFSSKEEIMDYTKDMVLKLKKNYGVSLLGYYQMNIYANRRIGMFVELKKLDDLDFDLLTIDFKVVIFLDQPFYLKTRNFDIVSKCRPLYYSHDFYYIDLETVDNYIPYLEFGDIVYGKKLEDEISVAMCLKKMNQKKNV